MFQLTQPRRQVSCVVRRRRAEGRANAEEHPIAWARLLDELADAHEHLSDLLAQMQAAGAVEESDFAVQLGHVFAHLNRAWHGRDDTEWNAITSEEHGERSRYPSDLPPVG